MLMRLFLLPPLFVTLVLLVQAQDVPDDDAVAQPEPVVPELPPELHFEIARRLDNRLFATAMLSTSSMGQMLQEESIRRLLRPDDAHLDLQTLISAIATQARFAPEFRPHASAQELCYLYDRVMWHPLPQKERWRLLQTCAAFLPNASELFAQLRACDENRSRWYDGRLFWRLTPSLTECLTDLQIGFREEDGSDFGLEAHQLVRLFITSGKADLLYDPPTVLALIRAGVRLHLVDVLFQVRLPDSALAAVVPLYTTFWSNESARFNSLDWNRVKEVLTLTQDGSRTTPAEFWAIDGIRPRFRTLLPMLNHNMYCIERIQLLIQIEFPFLDELLAPFSQDRLVRIACFGRRVEMFASLLLPTPGSICVRCPSVKFDLSLPDANGRLPVDYLRWEDIAEQKSVHPDVLFAMVDSCPPSLWREEALRLLTDPLPIQPDEDLLWERLLESVPQLKSFQRTDGDDLLMIQDRRRLAFSSDQPCEVQSKLRALLTERGFRGLAYFTFESLLTYAESEAHFPALIDIRSTRHGFTLLHIVALYDDIDLIKTVVAVPGVDITVQDSFGCVPARYFSARVWSALFFSLPRDEVKRLVQSDLDGFIRAIRRAPVEAEDVFRQVALVKESLEGWRSPSESVQSSPDLAPGDAFSTVE